MTGGHERGQTWIRTRAMGPHVACVWVCLGEGRMLMIFEDGHTLTTDDVGFVLPSRMHAVGAGFIVRIA